MPRDAWRRTIVLGLLVFWNAAASYGRETPGREEKIEFFERKIRPVLHEHCIECHGPEKQHNGLRLDSGEGLRRGGDSGPAIDLEHPEQSLVIQAMRHESFVMPPLGEKLPEAVVANFVRWIAAGAVDPRIPSGPANPIQDAAKTHWAFQPINNDVSPPRVENSAWPRSSIDRFLLAKQEEVGIRPAPAARRRALIRRATWDLIGLPPTPEQIEAFVSDPAPDAYSKVIDRLLASPYYGERWGRHWLDVVRYADTAGETADFPVPQAWRYRNYVIDAFNDDKPYDEFIREQIAGDILASTAPSEITGERYAELITATGYLAIARRFGFNSATDHYLTIEDTIDTLGKSILGLTIACARCHDHKYDPIPTVDYYSLYGILASTQYAFPGCEAEKRPRDLVPLLKPAEYEEGTDIPMAYAVSESETPHDVRIQKRGDPKNLGEQVPRQFLEVLGGQRVERAESVSGRLQLAQWLTDPGNPLTARVLVNRIWQHHFGRGLVATPNNFGLRGRPPTHPKLLDWLATEFIRSGWSIKHMHRVIMQSAAYRLSIELSTDGNAIDPENRLYWRFERQRLDAEQIRDGLLAVSGQLDRTPGKAHPFPPVSEWNFTQHAPFDEIYKTKKRSVYLMTPRIRSHPFLGLFDGADPNAPTARRTVSTVPPQALFFMNAPFPHEQAAALAERLARYSEGRRERTDYACRLLYGRPAGEADHQAAKQFLDTYAAELRHLDAERRQAELWSAYARVLLSCNEFLYVE